MRHIHTITIGLLLFGYTMAHAKDYDDEFFLKGYNAYSKVLSEELTYDSLRNLISDGDDYLIVAYVDSGDGSRSSIKSEVLIVKRGEQTNFIHMSSRHNRKLTCDAHNTESFDFDFALNDLGNGVSSPHAVFALMEKRFNGKTVRFGFDASPSVKPEVDTLRYKIFYSMLNSCATYEVSEMG